VVLCQLRGQAIALSRDGSEGNNILSPLEFSLLLNCPSLNMISLLELIALVEGELFPDHDTGPDPKP
jgi:hypothetical protein